MKNFISVTIAIVWSLTGSIIFSQSLFFNYTAPVSGSEYINPEQSIILKTGFSFDSQSVEDCQINITGSESGQHTFTWILSEDLKTLVITSDSKFSYGETVVVNVLKGMMTNDGIEISGTDFSFKIKIQDNLPFLKEFYKREFMNEKHLKNDQNINKPTTVFNRDNNLPADYPAAEMVHFEETDDNYIFFTLFPRTGAQQYSRYLSITDKYGIPLFFRKTTNDCFNFHVMNDGNIAYAWDDASNPENNMYYIMDSSYVVIESVKTGNGYNMDKHDMLLLENGHYLLMSYDPQPVDMSQIVIGGNPNAIVTGLVIQEVDTYGTVYFQWRSWDHFLITDATNDINLLAANIDYVHGNAFEFDQDGNLLISSRHLDEITKINYETGDIMYRFGLLSKNNEFIINNDPNGFSHQHDVRVLPNGNITIYDNGNLHPNPFSQAIEYSINEISKTADRVWYYQHNPSVYGSATGCYRRGDNGKNLIGWGAFWPLAATEVLLDHTKTFEIYLPDGVVSYRVLKSPWNTNLFIAPSQIHFGNYEGFTDPIFMILPIQNNSDELIRITSTFNHQELFEVVDGLPVSIPAGETIELTVSFSPDSLGVFNDRLTLNYDKFGLGATERIARQVNLCGIWDNSLPIISYLPEYGTIDVNPESNVTVLFSEPVRKAGGEPIQDSDIPDLFSFMIDNLWGDNVQFTGTISEDRMQIVLTPIETLAEMQQYFVELHSSTIEDDDGDVIEHPEATVFETGLSIYMMPDRNLNQVMFFPSPFNDRLVISSQNTTINEIYIYNSSGIMVLHTDLKKKRYEISTSSYPEGIYLVKVFDNNGDITVSKVVKVK